VKHWQERTTEFAASCLTESSAKRVGLGSELLIKSVFGLRDVTAVGNALKFTHKGSVTVRVTVVTDQWEISSFGASTVTSVDAGKLCTCVHLFVA
jgi:hypothetical protein